MAEPTLSASSRKTGEDLLVGGCGFITSLLTAVVLWWAEKQFGFAFYSWTFWFVIPVGALLSGFAGASGYYAGSWFLNHRPTRILLLNIVIASVSTFFLVHYLSYATLVIDGKSVSDYVPFSQYLDLTIRSMSMGFRLRTVEIGSTGELGNLGYVVSLLQILGFAAGGFAVYAYLEDQPYCERCSRYLTRKGQLMRYTGDAEGLQATTGRVFEFIGAGSIVSAIDVHKGFGNPAREKNDHLRSSFEIRFCKKCERHWVKFSVAKQSGSNWRDIPALSVAGFTEEKVSL